ncbi:ABC transporter permease [Nocardioides daeguensis]|uniref:Exporter of polyketide antibiotics n=1 Tax=Nocardioides daeguensis TaxID=908359 RepID=A0ABP6W3G7_9ACTN|nr:hypothetical protein [Nocardioides daeguensis]MBV6726645.1 hypothetical protein [Nocardioides daeguensis]MCR1774603.1 hypothetical protein [Nocardioides daeguensis]
MRKTDGFTGTGALVRLALRRDRIRIPVWVVSVVGLLYFSAASQPGLYQTQEQIDAYGRMVTQSSATVAIAGPVTGLDSLRGIVMYETYLTVISAVSILAVLMMSRHTRAEEESGRTELLRATEVGRHAGAAAALIATSGTCLLIGAGMALVLPATPLTLADSLVYGAAMSALGIFMAALTLCFAQVFVHSRSVSGAGLAAFLVFYLVRAIGDVRDDATVWFTPIGWAQATRVPTEDRLWPVLLPLLGSVLLLAVAVRLAERRDFGAGLLPSRSGPARASRLLSGPVGLAWRQQRGALLAWSVALGLCGALIGTLGTSMQDMVRDNPALADYLASTQAGSVIDAYQATFALIMTLAIAGYAIWAAGRVLTEEGEGRTELVIAGPVGRVRSVVSDLVVAGGGVLVLLVVAGFSSGASYAAVVGDRAQGLRILVAPLIYFPAIAVLLGVLLLAYGWAPHWTWVGWLVLAFEVVIGWLGGVLGLPDWIYQFSVFDRAPRYPAEDLSAAPLLAMGAGAALLLSVGLVGFRRRDLR